LELIFYRGNRTGDEFVDKPEAYLKE